jgi:hypothetical protein
MPRFENVETSALLDMLAEYTRRLTEIFMKKDRGEEYEHCKYTIQELQSEIQRRKKSGGKKNSSDTKNSANGSI